MKKFDGHIDQSERSLSMEDFLSGEVRVATNKLDKGMKSNWPYFDLRTITRYTPPYVMTIPLSVILQQ